jgi:heme exporter protein D
MNLGAHAGFIISAYAISALVVLLLIGWIVLDYRGQTRTLEQLEARGLKRRSAASSEGAP